MGAVKIQAEPTTIIPKEKIVIKLTLDTHTVELDYDFTTITSLIDSAGIEYIPTIWSSGSGGHHLSGDLTFEPSDKSNNQSSKKTSKQRLDEQQLTADSYSIKLNIWGIEGLSEEIIWD
jgi:hypothetical protein